RPSCRRESLFQLPLRLWSIYGSPALLRHHGDTAFGDVITLGAVRFRIETDYARFRNLHARINDRAADPAIPPDLRVRHQNRILYFTVTVYAHARRQHAVQHAAAGNDAARTHDGIHRHAHAAPFLREN